MEVVIKNNVKYCEYVLRDENEFESIFQSLYLYIFGEGVILLPKKAIVTNTDIKGIPDAFIIDPKSGKWFIVEIELSEHNVYQHIVPQLTKFATAIKTDRTRKTLIKHFENEISKDNDKINLLRKYNNEIFKALTLIVEKEPEIVVFFEKSNEDFNEVTLPFNTQVRIIKIFHNQEVNDFIYSFTPIITDTLNHQEVEENAEWNNNQFLCKINNYICQLGDVVKTEQATMTRYSYKQTKNGYNFIWMQPDKNSVLFYLTPGKYDNTYNRIVVSNRNYHTIRFKYSEIDEKYEYICQIIKVAFNTIKTKKG